MGLYTPLINHQGTDEPRQPLALGPVQGAAWERSYTPLTDSQGIDEPRWPQALGLELELEAIVADKESSGGQAQGRAVQCTYRQTVKAVQCSAVQM